MIKNMMAKRKIFVPFIDGLLYLDCPKCRFACCQEGLLSMNLKEKKHLLKKYPYLRNFFFQQINGLYAVKKYPNCWFLEKNGLCCIQKNFGYALKPFICRLHPFYVLSCKGSFVINVSGCNMLRANNSNRRKGVFQKLLLKNAQEAIANKVFSKNISWDTKRLDLEKKILEASKMFLGNSNYLDFAVCQLSIAKGCESQAEIKSELLELINLWKTFLGVDELNLKNKRLSHELTALTSLLRLYVSPIDAKKASIALLALYFYMTIFLKIKRSDVNLGTFQQVLSDIPLGLACLSKDDLKLKHKPIEEKLRYLYFLLGLRARKLNQRVKNAGNFLQKL